jgi:hypothetical protein
VTISDQLSGKEVAFDDADKVVELADYMQMKTNDRFDSTTSRCSSTRLG